MLLKVTAHKIIPTKNGSVIKHLPWFLVESTDRDDAENTSRDILGEGQFEIFVEWYFSDDAGMLEESTN